MTINSKISFRSRILFQKLFFRFIEDIFQKIFEFTDEVFEKYSRNIHLKPQEIKSLFISSDFSLHYEGKNLNPVACFIILDNFY